MPGIPDAPKPKDAKMSDVKSHMTTIPTHNGTRFDFGKPHKKLLGGASDPDKDGYPSVVDCEPHNSKKQGPLSWVISKVKNKPYKEVEQERYASRETKLAARHETQLTATRRQTELTEAKAPLEKAKHERSLRQMELGRQKMSLGERRTKMMGQRQKAMGPMPSMIGGGMMGEKVQRLQTTIPKMTLMTPAPSLAELQRQETQPAAVPKKKKRRRKSKRRKRR